MIKKDQFWSFFDHFWPIFAIFEKFRFLKFNVKLKESDRLYTGFREFVPKDKYKEYDNEYLSRKTHTKKFMVSFINKYVDVKKLSKKVKRDEVQSLCAFFLNDYSFRARKQFTVFNKYKAASPDFEKNFLFRNTSSFFQNDSKSEKSEEERENEELLKKVDLMFRRIELRDMDLQYDLFDEKKLKDVERWYTDK